MKIRSSIDDHFIEENHNKVRELVQVEVDGRIDHTIFFDEDDFFVILSDISEIEDDLGNVHTEDILEYLKDQL